MIAILLFVLQGFTLFLPVHGHTAPTGQGMGGYGPVDKIAGSWVHNWSPCWPRSPRCVDAFKNNYTLPWTNEAAVRETLRECDSGYMMLMNEPVLANLSLAWQSYVVRRVDQLRQIENERCKILCCGTISYSPPTQYRGYDWIRDFWRYYRQRYGVNPPLDGVHFHAYAYDEGFVVDTLAYIDRVRRVYPPGTEVWISEYGSLTGEHWQQHSIDVLGRIAPLVDRYAFFVAHSEQHDPDLFTANGRLTDWGKSACGWDGNCWVFGGE